MDWTLFAIFFAACGAAASTGAMFQPGTWYDSLDKPRWTPPDWMFPVAWTLLYIAIAVAATRVAVREGNAHAMAFWAMQIAFNTLWSPVFFGLRKLGAAAVVLAGLWVAVLGTLVTFWTLDTTAGLLIAPYLVWVSYAGALNISIWQRERRRAAAA
ncbi:MAG: tryptophan-rich sensory protein [Rhodobacteraceae bacterium]|jgi:tryptophan-rich sensory protein|nr:tryptophan-rich sensory protein [Paracoccaceae bacterium]